MINSQLAYFAYAVVVFLVMFPIIFLLSKKILKDNRHFLLELLVSTLFSVAVSALFAGPLESMNELIPTYILTPLFQRYTSPVEDNCVKISSPRYAVALILQDGFVCKEYDFTSEYETIKLCYNELDLDVAVTITPNIDFNSIEEYYKYFYNIHAGKPNFYHFLGDSSKKYAIFSFNQSNDEGDVVIYYVLTYYENGIWCSTEFVYPIGREPCNRIVENYYSYYINQ